MMEAQPGRLICMKFLFMGCLIFFLGGRSFSASGEVNVYVKTKDSNTSTFSYSAKYLFGSYSGRYDSMLDSDFQDFKFKLLTSSCKVLQNDVELQPRLAILQRSLIGEGSHRRLVSSIRYSGQASSIPELPAYLCRLIVVERLPFGVFADPFELQNLVHHKVFTEAAVFGDTNLELPSFLSNRTVVEIHMDLGCNSSGHVEGLEINIVLPLHARYPPLEDGGYSTVKLNEPDIFMNYKTEQKPHNWVCLLTPTIESDKGKTDVLVWNVPCGIKAHTGLVTMVTFVSALLSTLFIVLTSFYGSNAEVTKDLKES
ncbi:Glycosylphosphatidylinositol-mannosyltransferase I, PIG-X/PBN1 [Dillenia turbinata]|uniref:Glycosylphosphatidylinositol-mannosyltransferase I, PIG-X/PBN1 n=1 Tax=Dillenia turbinata TaxID=194707 RepID=A0AAN8WER0_9MAGN